MSQEDREYLINGLKDKELFKEIIKSRDKNSANGPDGISYEALQLRAELSAQYLMLLSKLMFKYDSFPSPWSVARTILLFKKARFKSKVISRNGRSLKFIFRAETLTKSWEQEILFSGLP